MSPDLCAARMTCLPLPKVRRIGDESNAAAAASFGAGSLGPTQAAVGETERDDGVGQRLFDRGIRRCRWPRTPDRGRYRRSARPEPARPQARILEYPLGSCGTAAAPRSPGRISTASGQWRCPARRRCREKYSKRKSRRPPRRVRSKQPRRTAGLGTASAQPVCAPWDAHRPASSIARRLFEHRARIPRPGRRRRRPHSAPSAHRDVQAPVFSWISSVEAAFSAARIRRSRRQCAPLRRHRKSNRCSRSWHRANRPGRWCSSRTHVRRQSSADQPRRCLNSQTPTSGRAWGRRSHGLRVPVDSACSRYPGPSRSIAHCRAPRVPPTRHRIFYRAARRSKPPPPLHWPTAPAAAKSNSASERE